MDLVADLDDSYEDPPEIKNFLSNLEGVTKLWRLAEFNAPNFFKLRPFDKGKISLVDILPEYIEANSEINLFDFSFAHLVRNVRKWKQSKDIEKILNSNCLYLVVNQIAQRVRSDKSFMKKISYIAITPGQEEKPLSHHWDLVYTDEKYDSDQELIDLLMSCCELNPDFSIKNGEYVEYIYSLNLISPQAQVTEALPITS